MNPDWINLGVIQLLNGRRVFPWAISDIAGFANPTIREFIKSRLAWVSMLTGIQFPESDQPYLTFKRVDVIPGAQEQSDGLTRSTDTYADIFFTSNELTNRNQFVLVHELGHAIGLSHPYGNALNPDVTNRTSIMSGSKSFFEEYRTTFSVVDRFNLQQLYGVGDMIIGTKKDDKLNGSAVPDVITGLGGADQIKGGLDSDWLIGGGGRDTFIFKPVIGLTQSDVIEDFSKQDYIRVKGVNPKDIEIEKGLGSASIFYKNQELVYLPYAQFLSEKQILF